MSELVSSRIGNLRAITVSGTDENKAKALESIKAGVKDIALGGNIYDTGLQVSALTNPSEFIENYETFLAGALDIIINNNTTDLLKAYSDLLGYSDSDQVLMGTYAQDAVDSIIDMIVGSDSMNRALSKLNRV